MKKIEISRLSLIWFWIWGWILLYSPLLCRYLRLKGLEYRYDENTVYIKTGIFSQQRHTFPLHKISNIETHSNIFGNGTIGLFADEAVYSLRFVKNAKTIADELWAAAEASKKIKNVRYTDMF